MFLTLSPTPQFVTPGSTVSVHWGIGNIDPATHSLSLEMVLPAGAEPPAGEGTFDDATRNFSMPVPDVTGQFKLQTDLSLSDTSFQVALTENGQSLAAGTVTLLTQEQFTVGKSGGTVSAMGGRVQIVFPAGALPEDAKITVGRPDASEGITSSLSGHPFQIKAHGLSSNTDLHQFSESIEIQAKYGDFGIPAGHESELYVWWHNPGTGDWEALLSNADPDTGIVSALTDHFSTFDIDINDWQAHAMPSVDAFQVSSFTGAATYQLPIQVPDGPGGLKPDLTLSYNSQLVDQSTLLTQPGWAGMGWSLDMPSIMTDDHGDNTTSNDSWILDMGDVTSRIVKLSDGTFHDLDEKFSKISYDSTADTWTIWDKTGNVYYFETKSQRLIRPPCGQSRPDPYYVSYGWSLSRLRNVFGQELQYAYTLESKTVGTDVYHSYQGKCMYTNYQSNTAMYPSTITYPGGRLRIRFELESRSDYTASWATDNADHLFLRSRLHAIYIEAMLPNDSVFTTTRKYVFSYASDNGANVTFPGHAFSQGGKATTLVSVQMYGTGAAALPATTFTYDGLHLIAANNGYGGSVTFTYDSTPWVAAGTTTQVTQNATTCFSGWALTTSGYITAPCRLNLRGTAETGTMDTNLIRPGGAYKISATLYGGNPYNLAWQVGLDGSNGTATQFGPSDSVFIAPINSSRAEPMLQVADNGSNYLTFDSLTYEFMPAFYRVTQKTYNDGQGHSYQYGYSYTGGAMNNPTDSLDCGTSCLRYFPLYTEFRGHSQVTETGPDGKQTITTFYQGDTTQGGALAGRPSSMTVKDASGNVLTKTLYTYSVTPYADTLSQPTGFGDVKRAWVTTTNSESRTYEGDGQTYSAAQAVYGYNASYGNQISQAEQKCTSGCVEGGSPVWSTYRTTQTDYFPNASAYLVGLPARQTVLDGNGVVLARTLFLYDNASSYNLMPTAGVLTATRTLTDGTNYSQASYSYDTSGNQTTVTTFGGYGTETTAPTTGARTSYTCYGGGGTLDGQTCADDGFHVYALWTRNALHQQTSLIYDYLLGLPTSETDPNNAQTSATYDSFGRITSVTRPLEGAGQSTLAVSYVDSNPFTTTITQRVDATSTFAVTRTYDGMGRQIESNSGGVIVDYGYDAYGRIVSQSTPYSGSESHYATITAYDVIGRPLSVAGPDGTETSYVYSGLSTTATDPDQHSTTTTTDAWGRTVQVAPPAGPSVTYSYDELDHLVSATRGGVTTTMTYDSAGRKTSMADPDMGNWSYGYDAVGNLKTQTDAAGCVSTLTYDLLNRLTVRSASGASCGSAISATYTYDYGTNAIGRRGKMTDDSGSTVWTYDARGRVIREDKTITGGGTFTTSWTYNSANLPLTMTYPDNETVTYSYNSRMLLQSLSGTSNYVSSLLYDSAGRLTSSALGNGLTQTFGFYAWNAKVNNVGQGGRLQNLLAGNLQDLNYTYDAAGNVTQVRDDVAAETNNYGYDALNRLTSWTLNNGTPETYGYDGTTGNLATQAGVAYYYDANHPHAVGSLSNGSAYQYDANGDMTQRVVDGDTFGLSYDAVNQLSAVTYTAPTGGESATFRPQADAYVDASTPTTNYGTGSTIRVDASPDVRSFLRFSVSGLNGRPVTGARLLIFANTGSTSGITAARVTDNSWGETTVTYSNMPALGTSLATSSAVTGGTWISLDASSYVTGEGTYSFGVTTAGATAISLASRESGANAPKLVLTLGNSATLAPQADSYVDSSAPTTNYGTSTQIRVDGSPDVRSLLRFTVSGLDGRAVTQARLQIYANSSSTSGITVSRVSDNSWGETSVNYSNMPAAGSSIATSSAVTGGTWISLDVTSYVNAEGTYSFTVTTAGATAISLASRESGVNAPRLVLTLASARSLTQATFNYDGDGKRVKSVISTGTGSTTTYFVGNYYELTGSTVTKYYYAGALRVAMRVGGTVYYLLADQLGSTSITTDANGAKIAELRYDAWGEVRYSSGSSPSHYSYTGQYSNVADFGLMFYNARWYDSSLGRFAQADTIVPDGVQGYDRYAYGLNDPVKYVDRTGHYASCYGGHLDDGPQCTKPGWINNSSDIVYSNAKYQDRCAAGKDPRCPGGTGGMLLQAAGMIVAGGAVDYALAGGAAADATAPLIQAGYDKLLYLCLLSDICRAVAGIAGNPAVIRPDPNQIGSQGVQQVSEQLPVETGQMPVVDSVTGQLRVYDGRLINDPDTLVEIKTSTRGVTYATQFIRNQVAFDANMAQRPLWIFVNSRPSGPLMELLRTGGIPWTSLH